MRSVARPVANLGNTCYMNAVLQALAHAPDLLLAMDCEPHHKTCPIAKQQARKSPSPPEGTRKSSRRRGDADANEFCALCELEYYVMQAHECDSKKPVAPTSFVNGFIERVAPWFQLGVQEDSHEFLRLLIDSMQKSCENARNPGKLKGDKASKGERDKEYPFSLFRGTVESNVVCGYCKARSSTRDPIEDVGLEVTTPPQSERSSRSSRNASPAPSPALWDVKTAFQKYAKREALDASYKCENCKKIGKATKQTKLASIPPILTLHLKRFRYGDRVAPVPTVRRSNRSEVSQLTGADAFGGKSGATKIEGHVKFDMFFDLKQFLTEELQEAHDNMYCRLFAVIVHAGTSPHSGHYVAYVRNISKNEWWKMDDSRVTAVTMDEVLRAEAYMLFYRVVNHPVAQRLSERNHIEKQQKQYPAEEVTPTKKRPPENDVKDGARKSSLPPHLLGAFQKMADLIADDIQISESGFAAIKDASKSSPSTRAVGGKSQKCCVLSTPVSHVKPESDIVGGTEKYKRALCELFYQLKDHPSTITTWLASLKRVAVEAEPEDLGLL